MARLPHDALAPQPHWTNGASATMTVANQAPLGAPRFTVSVVVCAYTEARWSELTACVRSLQNQTRVPDEIVVVVDHNPSLLERAERLGVAAVPNRHAQGLSGARNTGVEVTRGEVIAFLDDDAEACPDWLEKLLCPLADARVLGVGGAIEPAWVDRQATWLPEEFYWVLGCTHRGAPKRLAPVRNPFGASMCMRREIFQHVGLFRDGIGRNHRAPMGCEETELCIRARRRWKDSVFVFQPDSIVRHRVPGDRVRWRYFVARCYAEGTSKALISRFVGRGAALTEEAAYTARVLPVGVLRGLRDSLVRRDGSGALRAGAIALGFAATVAGYVRGHWGFHHVRRG
ncbi:MAG TPA: glycosyltransferase family 2 protein [Chloroflexota bacterium]|nr:glycosyltransferase family 2 protein [Chloroflexota bacterium]